MKKIIRTTSQWLLIGLLSTSPILPGISTLVEASTDENITAQDNSFSQQKSTSMGFDYDETTGTLSISSGVLDNPVPLRENSALTAVVLSGNIKKIVFTGKVTAIGSLSGFFSWLPALTSIEGLENLDTSNVTDMSSMFKGTYILTSLDLSNLDTSNVTDMSSMFEGTNLLTSLDLSNLDTSNVTDMSSMFKDTYALTSLDVSSFNTSNVTNMEMMFDGTASLISLDVSSFNTSNVTNMEMMFAGAELLTSLDVSNFDTSNVTNMEGMFANTASLTSLDLSNFDTSNVTDMHSMFNSTNSLTSLDLSGFNTSNVTDMGVMFMGTGIRSLDLSNFDTSNVTDISYMFWMSEISDLNLSSFDTSKAIDSTRVFLEANNLMHITLGKNFGSSVLKESHLSNHQLTENYTDKWQNVGNGTVEAPEGGNVWTSDEFMTEFSPDRDADTYVWQPQPKVAADVTVKYIDTKGNTISDDIVKSGNIGDDYSTEQKDIDGYTFKEVQGNPTGQFTDTAQTVTYMYSKNSVIGEDLSHITVHDSSLKVGDKWSPEENFDEATDFEGNIENFSDIIVDGTVDTTKPGTYEVTYKIPEEHLVKSSLVEGHHSATAKIVVANKDTETGSSGSESNNSGNNTGSSDKKNSVSNNLSINNELSNQNYTNQDNRGLPKTGENSSALVLITGLVLIILAVIFFVLR